MPCSGPRISRARPARNRGRPTHLAAYTAASARDDGDLAGQGVVLGVNGRVDILVRLGGELEGGDEVVGREVLHCL